jgi:uncharacterized lipoprotein YmbA
VTKPSMPHQFVLPVCIALTALLAACGSSPTVKYYTLSPQATASGAATTLALKIGPAEFPRALARSQIVTRSSSTRLKVDEYNVWAAPLENQFLHVLGDNLGAELGTHRITVYPAETTFPIDYQLLLDVLQFDGIKGDRVTLRVRWSILQPDGTAVDDGLFGEEQSTGSDSYDGLVAAHSKLVAALGKTLAARLEKLNP